MTRPKQIIVDGTMVITEYGALVITFDTNKETGEPYEVATIYDNHSGIMTYPLSRVELIFE